MLEVILLPCPPGALMQNDQETYFFSLDFNLAGQALPPISPPEVVAKFPRLVWGVLVFDVFIMNHDQHNGNIAYDNLAGKVQIFDHSHAFLAQSTNIEHDLAARENSLAIGGHCLANEIDVIDGMDDWINRVKSIPDYFIDGIISAGCECGIPVEKKSFLSSFMKRRRDNLTTLFNANMSSFPKLPKVRQ